MKCNYHEIKDRDIRKLAEALTQVKCCKCGQVIEVMSEAFAVRYFDKKRYENRLCEECEKGGEVE